MTIRTEEPKYFSKNGWNLRWEGGYGTYYLNNESGNYDDGTFTRLFVARFKYANANACLRHFARFLVENFTPAEYFAFLQANKSPLEALEAKGYVPYNIMKLRAKGLIK